MLAILVKLIYIPNDTRALAMANPDWLLGV